MTSSSHTPLRRLRAAAAGLALALLPAGALAAELPGPVVDATWLAANLDQVRVLDLHKGPGSYAKKGHIPGAVLLDWAAVRSDAVEGELELQYMLPDRATFESLMRSSGVGNDTSVVIAGMGKSPGHLSQAARVYWQLKYFGHDKVALLDGGTAAWQAAGQPMSTAPVTVEPGDFKATAERSELLATTAQVEAALADGSAQLIDNRTLTFHLGLDQRSYVYAAGHIPGSKLLPLTVNTKGKAPAMLREAEQIRAAAKAMGIDPDGPLIAYCNSGAASAGSWFVFHELLGNKEARLYDGSMHAWTKDSARPVAAMQMN